MTVRSKARITGGFNDFNSGKTTEVNSAVPDSALINSALLNEEKSRDKLKSRNINLRTQEENITEN